MSKPTRQLTPEHFCLDLARLFQSHRMYPGSNDYVRAAAERAVKTLHELGTPVRLTKVGDEIVLEDRVVDSVPQPVQKLFEVFAEMGWESLRFEPTLDERGLLTVLDAIKHKERGPLKLLDFSAGQLQLDDDDDANRQAIEGAGYLVMVPQMQELIVDLHSGKRGSWLRAHDVVRMMGEFMMSGDDLFGPMKGLKDHDEYTFTHALNVSILSLAIVRTMEVEDMLSEEIAMGAMCHDLGKQSVSAELINKPGRFTPEERAKMDRHPVEGAALILSGSDAHPPLAAVIAFEHHMRADCTGYPTLPVKKTPHPAALLVAVADTYDALRTSRSYQDPRTNPEALTILIKEVLDGRVHGIFVSVLARMLEVVKPGRGIELSDGRKARVLSEGEFDALSPLVETEEMEILDLSMPDAPKLAVLSNDII